MSGTEPLLPVIEAFGAVLTKNFSSGIAAQPEDQLKAPTSDVLVAAGKLLGHAVDTRTEAGTGGAVKGRPDIGVAVGKLLNGHVELKAPGKGADPRAFTVEADKKQWARFKLLPNLIYTDGREWALYRTSQREGDLVRLSGNPTLDGAKSVTAADAQALRKVLASFFGWNPIVPTSPKSLADQLAPLCRLLRDEVSEALKDETGAISTLADQWQTTLFSDVTNEVFADAYAQTLTYASLLARISDPTVAFSFDTAPTALRSQYGLLSEALRLLADPSARDEVAVATGLLERTIGALNPATFSGGSVDPWLYFYEDFLAKYDPSLRAKRGVYYTPAEVIQFQVRLTAEQLATRFGKADTFAEPDVTVMDPAMGTGAYLLDALDFTVKSATKKYGPGIASTKATTAAANLRGFELLVGPYAVAHLRLTQQVLNLGGTLPPLGPHVYLTDTLESPYATVPKQTTLVGKALSSEHKRALEVKESVPVLVCIGNPPYRLERSGDKAPRGGWVRFGDDPPSGTSKPLLRDFEDPVRQAGNADKLGPLYNDYVFFWRWAIWKALEQKPDTGGIVSFISASSFLGGLPFEGMRKHMREQFDHIWVIDLEGGSYGARPSNNVFAIRTPVAITMAVRSGAVNSTTPAEVHYVKIEGSRDQKFAQLDLVNSISDLPFVSARKGWAEAFLPEAQGKFFEWPEIGQILPWNQVGCLTKRTWPVGLTPDVLRERWARLLSVTGADRLRLLRKSRDRDLQSKPASFLAGRARLLPLHLILDPSTASLPPVRYAARSFDRRWIIPDARLIDYPSPRMWSTLSESQVYLTTFSKDPIGVGAGAAVAAYVPDQNHTRGSGSGEVFPLWRDADATEANVSSALVTYLSSAFGTKVSAEDVFAYVYAVLSAPSYVDRFWTELLFPPPRVPIAKDYGLFCEVVAVGRRLIEVHTYGERFKSTAGAAAGVCRQLTAISTTDALPREWSHDEDSQTLFIDDGKFGPVSKDVLEHAVCALQVLPSWLDARVGIPSADVESELDTIRPPAWNAELSKELLELIWALEETVAVHTQQSALLDRLVSESTFTASDLPVPTDAEREAPKVDEIPTEEQLGFDVS